MTDDVSRFIKELKELMETYDDEGIVRLYKTEAEAALDYLERVAIPRHNELVKKMEVNNMLLGTPITANGYLDTLKAARQVIQAKVGNKFSVIVTEDTDACSVFVLIYPNLCCAAHPIMISKWSWIDWCSTNIKDIAATIADELKKETTVVKEYMDRYEEEKDDN